MARLVEWHDGHAWDAERVGCRSTVCGRQLRERLRRIACQHQRPVLVRPTKEEILKHKPKQIHTAGLLIGTRPFAFRLETGFTAEIAEHAENPQLISSSEFKTQRRIPEFSSQTLKWIKNS